MEFTDHVYVVTGGGAGIGRAIAKHLVDEGARVCIAEADAHAGADAADEYGARVRLSAATSARRRMFAARSARP